MDAPRTKEEFKRKQAMFETMMKNNSKLDLAFLIDCTGSMGSYIKQTKDDIRNMVDFVKETYENDIKLGFVGYRDHSDGAMRIERLDFTGEPTEFESFVGGIDANGGDDAPEDVLGGLEAVLNLGWSNPNKVLIHIGDAPQHGEEFHDFGKLNGL